jgi:hypothetical protein
MMARMARESFGLCRYTLVNCVCVTFSLTDHIPMQIISFHWR